MEAILIIVIIIAAGGYILAFTQLKKHSTLKGSQSDEKHVFETEKLKLLNQIEMAEKELEQSRQGHDLAKKESSERIVNILNQMAIKETTIVDLNGKLATSNTSLSNLEEKLAGQKEELEKTQQKLQTEFKNLANQILEEKSQKFTEQNKLNLDQILKPLSDKIKDFEKRVEETYDKESKERFSLKEQVRLLYESTERVSKEATDLTLALKGDVKKQGNWGEMVLERILENSGLVKDEEYKIQFSTENDEGKRIQPDVIILLPEKKHIIIDSKVSLIAYEQFVNSEDDESRKRFAKEHITSVRKHIKDLSSKKYQSGNDLNAPEYVLLFIPIESSFSVAVREDQELFNFAWNNKIVIVSPSTLIATLMTISSIWKQENQTRNAIEIARQGGALYDKFVGFIDDLEKINRGIKSLEGAYGDAINKLSTGKGNLVSRAETIKKLGVKASKSLPEALTNEHELEDEQ
jgi:DNA recombination protein RmuC